jgi:hypothetical protein
MGWRCLIPVCFPGYWDRCSCHAVAGVSSTYFLSCVRTVYCFGYAGVNYPKADTSVRADEGGETEMLRKRRFAGDGVRHCRVTFLLDSWGVAELAWAASAPGGRRQRRIPGGWRGPGAGESGCISDSLLGR